MLGRYTAGPLLLPYHGMSAVRETYKYAGVRGHWYRISHMMPVTTADFVVQGRTTRSVVAAPIVGRTDGSLTMTRSLCSRLCIAATEYVASGPAWITLDMASYVSCRLCYVADTLYRVIRTHLRKLLDGQAVLLCDVPSVIRWQRGPSTSYALSGRWARRVRLGIVGLVATTTATAVRGGRRCEIAVDFFLDGDAHGLDRVLAAVNQPERVLPADARPYPC